MGQLARASLAYDLAPEVKRCNQFGQNFSIGALVTKRLQSSIRLKLDSNCEVRVTRTTMPVFQKIAAWIKWNRLGMSLRSRGVLGTANHFLERLADRRFDALHHVETTAKVPPDALGVESASHANEYTPVPAGGLSRVLADLPIVYREWDFVDIGAGKGRALFVAARFERCPLALTPPLLEFSTNALASMCKLQLSQSPRR